MFRFSITTLGCKVNQYDSAALAAELVRAGLEPASPRGPAELAVVNTCCVTAMAMQKSRLAIRRAIRRHPPAAILVTGCYGRYDVRAIASVLAKAGAPTDRAFVADSHEDLPSVIRRILQSMSQNSGTSMPLLSSVAGGQRYEVCMTAGTINHLATEPFSGDIKARRLTAVKRNLLPLRDAPTISTFPDHQRAFLKVQDGCDAFCSYCVVPYTRSVLYSRPVGEILRQCRELIAHGHREIVLSGVFLGAYGHRTARRRRWKTEPSPLPSLVRQVASLEGLWRVRLSSLEPLDLTPELLEVCRHERVAPHFHLPLQSGSPRVLAKMNRQYTPEQYRRTIEQLRAAIDRVSITTDIIVGFPAEQEEDFQATLDVARFAGFSKIHAFPFSAIEGTAAWNWRKLAPPPKIVHQRVAELTALEKNLAAAHRSQFVGEKLEGVVELCSRTKLMAMTDRYLRVLAPPPALRDNLMGKVVTLQIESTDDEGLCGVIVQASPHNCPRTISSKSETNGDVNQ